MTLSVAIIGLGRIGRIHLKALNFLKQEGLVRKILCVDVSETQCEQVSAMCDDVRVCDFTKLELKDYDMVYICTPTPTHYDAILHFIKWSHIFVEKPIVTDRGQLEHILREAQRSSRKIFVGHVERFNPVVEYAQKILSMYDFVHIIFVRHGLMPVKPELYVNVLWDLAVHDVDVFTYLLQDSVTDVNVKVLYTGYTAGKRILKHVAFQLQDRRFSAYFDVAWTNYKFRKVYVHTPDGMLELDLVGFHVTQSLGGHTQHIMWPLANPILYEDRDVLLDVLEHVESRVRLERVLNTYDVLFQIEKALKEAGT